MKAVLIGEREKRKKKKHFKGNKRYQMKQIKKYILKNKLLFSKVMLTISIQIENC